MKTELKKDEKVILVTRHHWLYLSIPVLVILFISAGSIFIGSFALLIPIPFIIYLLYKYVEWRNNIWVVTNFRVIDEHGVISYSSKESPLDKINNVSYSQSLWGKIFGFGDVQIQTAAETGATTYRNVSKPASLKDTITRMQEEYKSYHIKKHAEVFAESMSSSVSDKQLSIADELEKLHQLKLKGIISEEEFNKAKFEILNSQQ
ncbi:MAG: hypothetical protein HGGPFJEG_01883 [Ignavibacteria bacterium]|nr:hypothetical protein [Ignavibacteria bacterium]